MRPMIMLTLLLAACAAPQPEPWPAEPLSPQAARDRAAELECIRQGELAERRQPWLGANNPRASVIGARVRNACLARYRGEGGWVVPY